MKRHANGSEHREVFDLIPWRVNGTLGERDRERVDAHVAECEECRRELASERRLCEEMAAVPAVEYLPAPSLKRLQASIDALESGSAARPLLPAPRLALRWKGLAAASLVIGAAAIGLVSAQHWGLSGARPGYHTVTTATPRAHDEVIRAVFAPSVTLAELQGILAEAQLRIVAGPTEAGVYSLAATSHRPVSSSLALLRGHAEVRFAESTLADGLDERAPETP